MADSTHIYNLKAVINEVGLSPATLRAWERRYGLLKPKRSPGGHRLYSRKDIEMLKWLVERQKEGLSISRAVEMWKSQPGSHVDISRQIHTPTPISGTHETIMDELRDSWLGACLNFDDQAANQVLDQAYAIAAPETICIEVLQKGLAKIGELWYAGSASVHTEHFASAIAMRRVNALLAATAPPTRPGPILAACPPGETHDFVLLLVTYLLKRRGWDVVYLGANVPIEHLDATIQSISPVLIVSAAQMLVSAASLRTMSESISSRGVPLAYGGGIFTQTPASIQCIFGYYLGKELAIVPQIVELLITTAPAQTHTQPISSEYSRTLTQFKDQETLIVADVVASIQDEPFRRAHLEVANEHFTQSIASALELGDLNLLDHSVTWLTGLLQNFGLDVSLITQYFATYRRSIDRYLGQDGTIIQNWLAKYILIQAG